MLSLQLFQQCCSPPVGVEDSSYLKSSDSDDRPSYVLVLVGDIGATVSLQPTASCSTSDVTVRIFLARVSVLESLDVFVSDEASHFENNTQKLLVTILEPFHRFSAVHSL